MRKYFILLLVLACSGCVTVKIPRYLEDASTYKKKYYASFEETINAAKIVLEDQNWTIADIVDPAIYEQNAVYDETKGKQALIFTETRQTSMLLFSRYSNLNVYVRTLDSSSTEIELRYHSVTPIFFKNFKSNKNDRYADKYFESIAQLLEK